MKFLLGSLLGLATFAVLLAAAPVSSAKTVRQAWPAETLTGQIVAVDPAMDLVIVKADGVPFDLDVRASTRIESGNQKLTLKDLSSDLKKNVSVHFVPERSGDVARSIQLMG